MAFKAVSNIKHGTGEDVKEIEAGTEVKESDFDKDTWADLLAAGAITGVSSDELKANAKAAVDSDQAERDRQLLARKNELDNREQVLDAKEADIKQQQENLDRDRKALEAERGAVDKAAPKEKAQN